MGWVVNATLRPLYSREREPMTIVQEAGRSGPMWKNITPAGVQSPDLPSHSESVYGLRYLKSGLHLS